MSRLTELKNTFLKKRKEFKQRTREKEYVKQMELTKQNAQLKKDAQFLMAGEKLREENALLKQKVSTQKKKQRASNFAGFQKASSFASQISGNSPLVAGAKNKSQQGGGFLDLLKEKEKKPMKMRKRRVKVIDYE